MKGDKMTKSKILWLTLAGWSVFFAITIFCTHALYTHKIITRTDLEQERASVRTAILGHDPDIAARITWCYRFVLIWSIGAPPLFIAAVVTRKEKRLSKRKAGD